MNQITNKLKTIIYFLCLISTGVSLPLSSASANQADSPWQAIQDNAKKKALIQFLKKRLDSHQNMSIDDIKLDLISSIDQNIQKLKEENHELSPELLNAFLKAEERVRSIQTKEEALKFETVTLKSLVSTTNFMFGITRALAQENQGPEDIAAFGLFCVLSIPADLVLLPFTFFATIITTIMGV